jgi:hypothetical protein
MCGLFREMGLGIFFLRLKLSCHPLRNNTDWLLITVPRFNLFSRVDIFTTE